MTQPVKIAFGGKMGVGKDTAVDYLIQKYGGKQISFAGPIYEILFFAQEICNFPHEKDRGFLQYIGTEWARQKNPNVWIEKAVRSVEAQNNNFISDLRFRNEFNALKENGWKCIKIIRSSHLENNRVGSGTLTHPSELELDSIDKWDLIIENNGSLQDFHSKLNLIML